MPAFNSTPMKKRILFILAILVVAILVIGGIFGYRMYRKYGLGEVTIRTGEVTVPVPAADLPPLTQGRSDWTCWRGPGMEGKSDIRGMITDWSNELDKVWEVDYLCRGEESVTYSGPVIRGNRLVIMGRDGDRDQVFCLEAGSGELLWHTGYDAPTDPKFGTGPRATPCIDGELVYTFGRAGDLACWRLYDGERVWKRNVMDDGGKMPNWGFSSSPMVLADMVIVQGGGEACLIAYDKGSGEVVWSSPGGEAGYSTAVPVVLDSVAYLLHFHGTGLALVDTADGSQRWDIPWETEYAVNAVTPVVRNDTVFITSGYRMGARCLKVSVSGADVIWESDVISSQVADLVLLGGQLYGYTANANNSGPFKCVDLATGTERWSTKEIGGGSLVYADGHLVCWDVKGNLHLLEKDPDRFILKGSIRDAAGKANHEAWTPPAIANGKLYLRHMGRLVCYELLN